MGSTQQSWMVYRLSVDSSAALWVVVDEVEDLLWSLTFQVAYATIPKKKPTSCMYSSFKNSFNFAMGMLDRWNFDKLTYQVTGYSICNVDYM